MKKLLLLLLLPTLLFSCKKEDINKNNVEEGSTLKLQVSSQYPLIDIWFDYYDISGIHHYIQDNDGEVDSVDIDKQLYVTSSHGYTLYDPQTNDEITTYGEGNYYLYIDNSVVDIQINKIGYIYQN